jgi:hypothetical protein
MTDDTVEWHKEQIVKNRALLDELEACNTARGRRLSGDSIRN